MRIGLICSLSNQSSEVNINLHFNLGNIMEVQTVDTLLLPFYGLVVVAGICGNSLFIAVVRRKRSMQTVINFMLLNVAVSDIISLFFCVPGITLRFFHHPRGIGGTILCKFVTMHLVAGISLLVSGLTLTLIAVERHNALLLPMDTRLKLKLRRAKIMMSSIWGFSLTCVLPLFIYQKYLEKFEYCHLDWNHNAAVAYWTSLATIVCICLSVICFCYYRILKAVHSKNILPPSGQGNRTEQDNKDRQKLIKLLLTVTGLFLVCFLPFVIVSAVGISTLSIFYQVSYFLVYCSCCVNPVVYVLQSANYRAGLKDLWNKRSGNQRERSLELHSHARIET